MPIANHHGTRPASGARATGRRFAPLLASALAAAALAACGGGTEEPSASAPAAPGGPGAVAAAAGSTQAQAQPAGRQAGALASVATAQPVLNFSDLISGPDTGLGDGQGSGVIVTVWGQHLGEQQGNSRIEYCDSAAVCRPGHVYYWKNADGRLPGGPANLFDSHRMQEIAFSVPDSAAGAGQIRVTVGGVASTLPFTVRPGAIFHVKSTGSDTAGNGSWARPWATVTRAVGTGGLAPAGSTVYVHDVNSGSATTGRGIYFRNAAASSTLAAQFAVTAYPNHQPSTTGYIGVATYRTQGFVASKLRVLSANCDEVANGQRINCSAPSTNGSTAGVVTNAFGRTVANYLSEPPGRCSSAQSGAIAGSSQFENQVSGHMILGNEIHAYGCQGTSKFHHTTYLTVRDGAGEVVQPWEWGWNYLHGNHAKNGIHNYDTGANCGNLAGPLRIHHNVVVDQGGAGITVQSGCGWSMDAHVFNNVLINVGLPAAWNGIDPGTADSADTAGISIDGGLLGTMFIHHNTVHTWNALNTSGGANGCLGFYGDQDNVRVRFDANLCLTPADRPFIGVGYRAANKLDNIVGQANAWRYPGLNAVAAKVPAWDALAVTADPLVTVRGAQVEVGAASPLAGRTVTEAPARDIYGYPRPQPAAIGAVEPFNAAPYLPTGR
ncbi:MAG: hypothetical protein HY855_02080 [Burkholderiales bacterium]|nr:hypothetical protein [Burkholderiales bacterium]